MRLDLTWGELARAAGGRLTRGAGTDRVAVLSTDSRRLQAGEAFWALVGMILAYPALNTVSHWLFKTVFRLSEPVASPLTPMDFFALDNPALYVAAIMAFLLLLVHFTIGDPEE